jgi:hypothetical protein
MYFDTSLIRPALVKHVNDEEAGALLKFLWQAIAEDE